MRYPPKSWTRKDGEWHEHPRFRGIYMKGLLTSTDNALASVNRVRVPPGGTEHALGNDGTETVELLTFFTPPLA